MTDNDIIEWKIASLEHNSETLNECWDSEKIIAYIAQRPELSKELDFIEQFWQYDMAVLESPTAQMDANFYQMLSKAQAAIPNTHHTIENKYQGFLSFFKTILSPQAIAQVGILGLVFVLGFNFNQPIPSNSTGLANLEQEVSSLNTMLAISLLDKSSASERLSGVAYSRTSDISNPVLQDKLLELIQTDKSTSVRLSVINRLSMMPSIDLFSESLLELAIKETNVLVQISLCRLLLSNGSVKTIEQLKKLLTTNDLNPEVREILQADSARSFT